MTQEIDFECNLQEIEISHTLDVSTIMSSLQEYPPGNKICSKPFPFADLNAKIKFYPQGNKPKNQCSVFICLDHGKQSNNKTFKDNRKIFTKFECGNIKQSVCQTVSHIIDKNGWGYSNFVSVQYITKNPLIKFTMKMNGNPQFVAPDILSTASQQQQTSLYVLSRSEGDITLEIIITNNEYNYSQSPPLKKRRLNDDDHEDEEDDVIQPLSTKNEMRASSIILRSSSAVFNNILSNNMIEKTEKKIKVYAKSVDDVDNMIYFMCTNKLRDNANPINIIELANYFQIKGLKYQCINKMIQNISIDNFVEIINIFDKYSIVKGYNVLIEFGKQNLEQLKQNHKFDELPHCFKMSALGMAEY